MLDWQLLAVGTLVLVALLPLVRKRATVSRRGGVGWILLLPGFVVGIPALVAIVWSEWRMSDGSPVDPFLPQPVAGQGFVSSGSCRQCHPDQYASWHASFHRTMTQPAREDTVFAPFDQITLESAGGRTFHLERRDGEFWVDMVDPLWDFQQHESASEMQTPPRVQRRIVMTTGSHHLQMYWTRDMQGALYQLPWVFYIKAQRWIRFRDSFLRPPDAPVGTVPIWNGTCIKCHAVGGQPGIDVALTRFDTRVGEIGIACEACHGPAENHVRDNRDPLRRYRYHLSRTNEGDASIVNPARRNARVSSEICGQCHRVFTEKDVSQFMYRGNLYRAGGDLGLDRNTVRYHQDGDLSQEALAERDSHLLNNNFWKDGTIRVAGREYNGLIESLCFQRGELSCLSCHSIHQSHPDDQLAQDMGSNAACLQCHQKFRHQKNLPIDEHTHHGVGSAGSLCYNCHMPHTTYGLFSAIRSHRVDSPNIRSSLNSGRPNACNLCHLDQTMAWSAKYLTEWYGQPEVELPADEQQIAASVLWVLRGDAAQRVIAGWHLGWAPAHKASGRDWLAPFLSVLLQDPYSAVRCVAYNALQSFPEYSEVPFDFVGENSQREAARKQVLKIWQSQRNPAAQSIGPHIPLDPDGTFRADIVDRLLSNRDNTPVEISE